MHNAGYSPCVALKMAGFIRMAVVTGGTRETAAVMRCQSQSLEVLMLFPCFWMESIFRMSLRLLLPKVVDVDPKLSKATVRSRS